MKLPSENEIVAVLILDDEIIAYFADSDKADLMARLANSNLAEIRYRVRDFIPDEQLYGPGPQGLFAESTVRFEVEVPLGDELPQTTIVEGQTFNLVETEKLKLYSKPGETFGESPELVDVLRGTYERVD